MCSIIELLIRFAGRWKSQAGDQLLPKVAERAGLAGVGGVFPAVGMSGYNPVFAGLFVVTNL